jgi:cell division protein FtsN
MIEQLIKDSLLTDKTVIIPTLGTLTLTNSDTMEVMFLSYLKFDDKKLTTDYGKIKDCTYIEAKDAIYNWVEKIIEQVKSGKKQPLLDLGTFQLNSEQEIDFISGIVADLQTVETFESEQVSVFVNDDKEIIEETLERPLNEEVIANEPTEVILNAIDENVEESFVEEKEAVEEYQTHKEEQEDILPLSVDTINTSEEQPAKKSKRKLVLAFIIIVLVAASSVFVYLYKAPNKKSISETSEIPVKTEIDHVEKTVIKDETTIQQPPITEENQSEVEVEQKNDEKNIQNNFVENSGLKYYVIVGSFEEQQNADRLVSDLKSKSFDAEIVQSGIYNMVSIGSFETLEEAKSKMQAIGNAWIFTK